MIIKAVEMQEYISSGFITSTDLVDRYFANSLYRDKIKKMFSRQHIFLLVKSKSILGYFFVVDMENIINAYLYVNQSFSVNDAVQLVNQLNQSLEQQYHKYIIISHIFDSVNILQQIYNSNCGNINSVSKMELSTPFEIETNDIDKIYSISTDSDEKELVELHYTCYFDDKEYMLGDWNDLIDYFFHKEVGRITLMCRSGDKLIGACLGWINNDRKYLFSICVHPDYRGKGIAKYLLHRFLQHQPQISCYLTVYEDNIDAIALYKQFGFEKTMITTIIYEKLEMKDNFAEYGFARKTIEQNSGEKTVFYIKGNENSKIPKPLFLYITGSGPCSIMMKVDDRVGSSIIFDVNNLIEEYLLVVVAKPYIPFYTDTDFEVPEKYYETDSLDHHARCNSEVIDYLIEKGMIDSAKIVVCGVSHGSDVAAQVALLNKSVTHLACLAGNGLPQTYNFINEVRKEFRSGKITEKEAESQTQYLYAQFKEIYSNPKSLKTWWGHTYKYWYSFFIKSTVNALLQLSIPIFFAKGTEDKSGCIEGTDIIPIEFLRHNKDNLTYIAYWGADHMFKKNIKDSINSSHKTLIADIWDWLTGN